MVSLTAFNNMLLNFADELEFVYPKEPSLALYNMHLKNVIANESKKEQPLQLFQKHVGPFSERILAKDETLLSEVPNLLGGIDLHQLYQSEETTAKTKEAIWSYLINLSVLSAAITSLPPELMTTIEQAATQLATSGEGNQLQGLLGGGGGGGIDMGTIMNMMGGLQGMFGKMT